MTKPKAVLFDLGNVLVSIRPGAFTDHLGIGRDQARREYQRPIIALVQRYESGQTTTSEYLDELSNLFQGRFGQDALRKAMLKVIGEPVPGMETLVQSAATRNHVALVSNTNELHFTFCVERIPALRHINKFFLSYQLKASKPAPLYYKMVLEELRISPDSILFIDDLEENVEGARSAGMNGILFTTPKDLRETLMELMVLPITHTPQL